MIGRILATAGFIFALALASGPAVAQEPTETEERPFDRDCMDDYGRDLCNADRWAAIVSSFDLERAEAVQAQGWRGVRVFTVDGYSQDMPMVSILSRGEGEYEMPLESVLEVRGVRATDSETNPSTLSRNAWTNLRFAAENLQERVAESAERQSGAGPMGAVVQDEVGGAEPEEIIVCLHAWVTITESLTDKGVLRRIRNACGDDPLFDASFGLSAQALRGFPHCNHLDPAHYRNESAQLSACLILNGENRIAAAEVLSLVDGAFDGLLEFLPPDVRWLGTSGDVISGRPAVEAPFSSLFDAAHFVVTEVVGGADGVVVSGLVARYVGDGVRDTTPVRQVWRRRGERWMLAELVPGSTSRVQLSDD